MQKLSEMTRVCSLRNKLIKEACYISEDFNYNYRATFNFRMKGLKLTSSIN